MNTTITRRYHFESAHWLPGVAEDHKCHRIHGHNYEIEVTVTGPQDAKTGFIIDFWDLDAIVQPILATVDHYTLNDVSGLQNPTAENIAAWFLNKINGNKNWNPNSVPVNWSVVGVRVYETKDCWADVQVPAGGGNEVAAGAEFSFHSRV